MYQAYCFYNKDKTPDWLMNHRMTVMIINFAFFRSLRMSNASVLAGKALLLTTFCRLGMSVKKRKKKKEGLCGR